MEVKAILNVAKSVTLDGSGNATMDFTVSGAWERWEITSIVFSTNQASTAPPFPEAFVYSGPISPHYLQCSTASGNQDTGSGLILADVGNDVHVVYSGGLAGSIATVTLSGDKFTRTQ